MGNIHCTIDSCHYWGQNNLCGASEILVTSDAMAEKQPDSVDAPKAQGLETTPANHCMETCCKTFTPKGSGGHHQVDGVFKK
ncbi:MAG: DUF1540 domain-containing protein [Clostridia bacterium]|nr:DUF1540 domain-containing protein [Clostridia bacterium]